MSSYEHKYFKYKTKYLSLHQTGGGKFEVGDKVVMQLTDKKGNLVKKDSDNVPVSAEITKVIDEKHADVKDIFNVQHYNKSLEPVLLERHGLEFYDAMDRRARDIMSQREGKSREGNDLEKCQLKLKKLKEKHAELVKVLKEYAKANKEFVENEKKLNAKIKELEKK